MGKRVNKGNQAFPEFNAMFSPPPAPEPVVVEPIAAPIVEPIPVVVEAQPVVVEKKAVLIVPIYDTEHVWQEYRSGWPEASVDERDRLSKYVGLLRVRMSVEETNKLLKELDGLKKLIAKLGDFAEGTQDNIIIRSMFLMDVTGVE